MPKFIMLGSKFKKLVGTTNPIEFCHVLSMAPSPRKLKISNRSCPQLRGTCSARSLCCGTSSGIQMAQQQWMNKQMWKMMREPLKLPKLDFGKTRKLLGFVKGLIWSDDL